MTFGATHGLLIIFRNFRDMSITSVSRASQPHSHHPDAKLFSAVRPVRSLHPKPSAAMQLKAISIKFKEIGHMKTQNLSSAAPRPIHDTGKAPPHPQPFPKASPMPNINHYQTSAAQFTTQTLVPIYCRHRETIKWVDRSFLDSIRDQVREVIPFLQDHPNDSFTLKEICGDKFWIPLPKGEQHLAGECMVHLVLHTDELPGVHIVSAPRTGSIKYGCGAL